MLYLRKVFLYILDSCLSWFTPAWRRKGREAAAAVKRHLNYHSHHLSQETQKELKQMYTQLKTSLLAWDKKGTIQQTNLVELKAESLPGFKRNVLVEVVESLFVIMVVFLGIRTYYAQPFRIPTGSMQPTLNGIIIHPVEEIPAAPQRWWDALRYGSSYVEETADHTKRVVNITEAPKWMLFTQTTLSFDDGSTVSIPSAKGAVLQYLKEQGKLITTPSGELILPPYMAGETIIRARVDAGDMVIVNRVAYHFRHPRRGETFVFDTRGIDTNRTQGTRNLAGQHGGTHYIKRLCGLPGDILQVQSPHLIINGKISTDPGILRVEQSQPPYNKEGYQSLSYWQNPLAALTDRQPLILRHSTDPNLREYAALGDNTTNSLDSRYWGAVHQYNIIGPAAFTLWPFTSHWGGID